MLEKIKCPERDSNPRHPDLMRAPFVRSGCRGFESRSGHLIFFSICSVYIDRHIRVDLSDDEHYENVCLCSCLKEAYPGFSVARVTSQYFYPSLDGMLDLHKVTPLP